PARVPDRTRSDRGRRFCNTSCREQHFPHHFRRYGLRRGGVLSELMNAKPDVVIAVKDLVAAYDDRQILRDINFEVCRGEVLVIVGSSGCGKSTLLKHMIGLVRPQQGEVWIEGENIVTAEGEARTRLLRHFGVVFQSGALFGSLTVSENVALPLGEFSDLPEVARQYVALSLLNLVALA